jgi:hypothetical protein
MFDGKMAEGPDTVSDVSETESVDCVRFLFIVRARKNIEIEHLKARTKEKNSSD